MCLVFFSIFVYITNLIIIGKHKDELNKRNNTKSLTIINDELVLINGEDSQENFDDYIPDETFPLLYNTGDCLNKVQYASDKCYDPNLDTDIEKIIDISEDFVNNLSDEKIKEYKNKYIGPKSTYDFVLKPKKAVYLFRHSHKSRVNLIKDLISIDRSTFKKVKAIFKNFINDDNGDVNKYNTSITEISDLLKDKLDNRLKLGFPKDEHHNIRLLLTINILEKLQLDDGDIFLDLIDDKEILLTHTHKISGDRIDDEDITHHTLGEQLEDDPTSDYHNLESLETNENENILELFSKKHNKALSKLDIMKSEKLFMYLIYCKLMSIEIKLNREKIKQFFAFEKLRFKINESFVNYEDIKDLESFRFDCDDILLAADQPEESIKRASVSINDGSNLEQMVKVCQTPPPKGSPPFDTNKFLNEAKRKRKEEEERIKQEEYLKNKEKYDKLKEEEKKIEIQKAADAEKARLKQKRIDRIKAFLKKAREQQLINFKKQIKSTEALARIARYTK